MLAKVRVPVGVWVFTACGCEQGCECGFLGRAGVGAWVGAVRVRGLYWPYGIEKTQDQGRPGAGPDVADEEAARDGARALGYRRRTGCGCR
jgi:hypothetical protein